MDDIVFFVNGRIVPSSRFRVYQFLSLVRSEFVYKSVAADYASGSVWSRLHNLRAVIRLRRAIVRETDRGSRVFIQRMLTYRNDVRLERLIFERSKNGVIVDFDDAIFVQNPNFSYTISNADIVIAGSEYLAAWARKYSSNVKIIPTCIDSERYTMKPLTKLRGKDRITIGWTGTKANLRYLASLVQPLVQLQEQYQFRFVVISDCDRQDLQLGGLSFEHLRWSLQDEMAQLAQLDIGLMPLTDDVWCRGKCGFKLIQYMATGCLGVASNIGVNKEIVVDAENGFLCSTQEEWYQKLERSLKIFGEPEYARIVGAARKVVEQRYSVQSQFGSFCEAVLALK